MQRTDNNFYRVVLEQVYGYDQKQLEFMSDKECEFEYEFHVHRLMKIVH